MIKDNFISLENSDGNGDVLINLLRLGMGELISNAVKIELAEFLSYFLALSDCADKNNMQFEFVNSDKPTQNFYLGRFNRAYQKGDGFFYSLE